MASIQRVASTFFRAIDEQKGTPYVFRQPQPGSETGVTGPNEALEFDPKPDNLEDSDQEELDRYIKEIEDAADHEWEEEEAAEREEGIRIRYWNKEDYVNRRRERFEGGSENSESSEGEVWDPEEEDSGDDFNRRNVKVGREKRGDFVHTEGYRNNEFAGSRRPEHDRSRNGSYRDGFRAGSFKKSSRSGRVGFDSGFNDDYRQDEAFTRADGRRGTGLRGAREMRKPVNSGSEDESWMSDKDFTKNKRFSTKEDYGEASVRGPRGMNEIVEPGSDDDLLGADEDFGNKGFNHARGYGDRGHRGSRGADRRLRPESNGKLWESDEDMGGDNRFNRKDSHRGMGQSRSRGVKSDDGFYESDAGEEPSLAASRDYMHNYHSDGGEKEYNGHMENRDESWDSD